jgi:hypothetical protein
MDYEDPEVSFYFFGVFQEVRSMIQELWETLDSKQRDFSIFLPSCGSLFQYSGWQL